jgi:hypothetical protein
MRHTPEHRLNSEKVFKKTVDNPLLMLYIEKGDFVFFYREIESVH